MEFKVGERLPKATLVIGDKTYKFYAPTTRQANKLAKDVQENLGNQSVISDLMVVFASEVSDCPKDLLLDLDASLFDDLVGYLLKSQKKN